MHPPEASGSIRTPRLLIWKNTTGSHSLGSKIGSLSTETEQCKMMKARGIFWYRFAVAQHVGQSVRFQEGLRLGPRFFADIGAVCAQYSFRSTVFWNNKSLTQHLMPLSEDTRGSARSHCRVYVITIKTTVSRRRRKTWRYESRNVRILTPCLTAVQPLRDNHQIYIRQKRPHPPG